MTTGGPDRPIQRALCLLLLGVALQAGGCDPLAPDAWEDRGDLLERSRARWEDEGILAYRFTSVTSCECIAGFVGPVETEVRDGRIVAVTPLQGDEPVPEEQWAAFHTIEELFDWIEEAIERPAYQFDVTYDPALGYPTRINLDFDERVIDDEILVHVTAVTVLERRP